MNKSRSSFIAACMGMFLFGIVMLSLGTINSYLVDKFTLDSLAAGSLASLLPFGILIGSLIFGPIVDRYGYKLLLILSTLLVILSILTMAYSNSFGLIQIAFFIIGISGGIINGGTSALGADVSADDKSAKLSFLGVFYGIGALSLPLITGILSKHFTYQSIIVGIAIFLILPMMYFILIKFPLPKQAQGIPFKRVISMFRDKVLILFGLVLFFQSACEGISNNWTTHYLKSVHSFTDDKALFSLTILVIGMTLGRLILSYVLKKVKPISAFLVSCVIMILSLVLIQLAESLVLVWIALAFLGAGLAAGFPVMLSYVSERYSDLSGIAFSLVLVIALLGNTLLNLFLGFVSRTYGMQHVTTFLTISAMIMMILAGIAFKENNKHPLT